MDENIAGRVEEFLLDILPIIVGTILNALVAYAAYWAVVLFMGFIFSDVPAVAQSLVTSSGTISVPSDTAYIITSDYNGKVFYGDKLVKADAVGTAVFAFVFGLLMKQEFRAANKKKTDEKSESDEDV